MKVVYIDVSEELQQNGVCGHGNITKRCLYNLTNVSYNDIVSQALSVIFFWRESW
jgi:hypothetical protein